jgi:predicted nuclease of predicted toxin-antitoxin system
MLFLMDEDIDIAVAAFLERSHEVRHARSVFGPGSTDPDNVAYARAQGAVLLTGDRPLAARLVQTRACACLHLSDLGIEQLQRVTDLLGVVEAEYRLLGDRFWMQIRRDRYIVGR